MKILPLLVLFGVGTAAASPRNLVQDPSYESRLRPWFEEKGGGDYFLAHEKVADAEQGEFVLALEGWDQEGAVVLSPAFSLSATACSFTTAIRLAGESPVSVEFVLFDETGKKRLASLVTKELQPGRKWSRLSASGIILPQQGGRWRLGISITGTSKGERMELDSTGLFEGGELPPVRNNVEVQTWNAGEFADGAAWRLAEEGLEGKVNDVPIAPKALSGVHSLGPNADNEARREILVKEGGDHRLWLRFMHSPSPGAFTMGLRQNGAEIARKEIVTNDPKYGQKGIHWTWDSVDADLAPGKAELFIKRPATSSSSFARLIDFAVLTNLTDYTPLHSDFLPKGYLRFVNESEGEDPFCLFVTLRRPIYREYQWFRMPGILSHAGFSGGRAVPREKEKWLAAGEASPWVRISDDLLPGRNGGNRVQILATRLNHDSGLVTKSVKGRLEFATGDERKIVKTIPVEQDAPRVLLTLPNEFKNKGDQIRSAFDYVAAVEAALKGEPVSPLPRNIELMTVFRLEAGLDDPRLIDRELGVLKRFGFNAVGSRVAAPEEALAFHARHGFIPTFSTTVINPFSYLRDGCHNAPDLATMERRVQQRAQEDAPVFKARLLNLMQDEPTAMTYEHMAGCPQCTARFREELRADGLKPGSLGVSSWEEVRPVLPTEKERFPILFYHTGLFRLKSLANLLKTANTITHRYYPPTTLSTVNVSPVSAGTWVDGLGAHGGVDPFLILRDGATDMAWTEDWGGYGASPQQWASTLALFCAARHGLPLGGYCVINPASNAPTETLETMLRLKVMHWLAAGAREINFYHYGPFYLEIDSWGASYKLHPILASICREIALLDPALDGAVRRTQPIAILYNRTAAIWRDDAADTEHDARYLHWALAHRGYDAGFIPEEDIESGGLSKIRVLYLNGVQIRRSAAEKIARWVSDGGILFATAGAATRDEYNQPLTLLDPVVGVESRELQKRDDPGRPMFETRTMPILGVVSGGKPVSPQVRFNRLGMTEKLMPQKGTEVFLRDDGGNPAGTLHLYGKGKAIRVAALPGLAYVNDAIRGADYQPKVSWFPRHYRQELAEFIAWPAHLAGLAPLMTASAPLATVARWDRPERTVLYLIDYSGVPAKEYSMTVPDAKGFTKARSIRGTQVQATPLPGGQLRLSFPLNVTDVLVLEH